MTPQTIYPPVYSCHSSCQLCTGHQAYWGIGTNPSRPVDHIKKYIFGLVDCHILFLPALSACLCFGVNMRLGHMPVLQLSALLFPSISKGRQRSRTPALMLLNTHLPAGYVYLRIIVSKNLILLDSGSTSV